MLLQSDRGLNLDVNDRSERADRNFFAGKIAGK